MANFVLIHGGSHGAWCWEPVISELESLRHSAFAFDLPGHGDDQTPRYMVTLETYVAAANCFLRSLETREITLVGHSIAGMILPEVIMANKSQILRVIFLAALVLDAGEAAIDLIPESRRSSYFEIAAASSDNTLNLDFGRARALFFNDLSEDEARPYYERLTPQPFAPYLAPVKVGARTIETERRYIMCTEDKTFPNDLCVSMASMLGAVPEKIEAGHDVMLSRPRELARVLAKDA